MKKGNHTRPALVDDDNMRSIMLERLSIVAARGGLEMEEKLKTLYGRSGIRACSFLWSSDRDHKLYKQKIAEYTKSPPPLTPPPAAQNYGDLLPSLTSFAEQSALTSNRCSLNFVIPQGMARKELDIMKFTAQFVVRYGIYFRNALWDRDSTQFKFLDKSNRNDIMHSFFCRLLHGYGLLIRSWKDPLPRMEAVVEGFFTALKKRQEDEGEDEVVDKVETDRRDFVVSSEEYFADIEDKQLLITDHAFRVRITRGIMRKELGVIKFTALFVVRYGNEFWDSLWDRVCTESEFQFLKKNPGNDTLFSQLLLAYGKVIRPWQIRPRKRNNPARMEAVLQGFFTAFHAFKGKQEEEGDEVVDKFVTDRRDFVVCDEYFQSFLDIEEHTPLPERLQMLHERAVPKIMTLDATSTFT